MYEGTGLEMMTLVVVDAVREVGKMCLERSQASRDKSRLTGCGRQVSECRSAEIAGTCAAMLMYLAEKESWLCR